MKITVGLTVFLTLSACSSTLDINTQTLTAPTTKMIEAVVEDALNPQRTWGEFPGHPNKVLIENRVHSDHSDDFVSLTQQVQPLGDLEIVLIDDIWGYLDRDTPDTLDEIALRFYSVEVASQNKARLKVRWAFSKRICGSDLLELENHDGHWRVTDSTLKSIC